MKTATAVLVSLLLLSSVDSARILGYFPYYGRSHFVMFETLMKGLAAKGHQVTVVSHFPQDKPQANYRDISLKGTGPSLVNNISADQARVWMDTGVILNFIWKIAGVQLCEDMLPHPVTQDLLKEKYDIFFSELWGSDCFLGIAHKMGIPHIAMVTTGEVPWSLARYGSPLNPSYQTNYFTEFSYKKMNFLERVYNTLFTAFLNIGYDYASVQASDAVMRKHLGNDLPHLSDIMYNSSLFFVNAHFSTHQPRPFPPNVIEVGGLHIPEPKPLPADLQKYLDDAKEGVVVFSLGSMIKSESFEQDKINSFVNVFRSLPQKVLWKFNGKIENQPKNLNVTLWLPQGDVLRHPNVKLFITHGGLMGTQEAVLNGVPLIGMPFFGDQRSNVKNYVELGIAELLSMDDVTEQTVREKVNKILSNPSYMENARRLSKVFKDRPQKALDTAIFWTEYVLRHNGAHHLRPAATQLAWYQYYLLDVLGVLLLATSVLTAIVNKITKTVFQLICRRTPTKLKTK